MVNEQDKFLFLLSHIYTDGIDSNELVKDMFFDDPRGKYNYNIYGNKDTKHWTAIWECSNEYIEPIMNETITSISATGLSTMDDAMEWCIDHWKNRW